MRDDFIYFLSTSHKNLVDYCCEKGYPLLISYFYRSVLQYYFDLVRKDPSKRVTLMVDSGAYTNVTRTDSSNTKLDKYIDFMNDNIEYVDWFVQMDCMPSTKEDGLLPHLGEESARLNKENYLHMRERCKQPEKIVPAYHLGEPYEYLHWLLDFEPKIDLIGLSGGVGITAETSKTFYNDICVYLTNIGQMDRKYHAFGTCSYKIIRACPCYTVDSSEFSRMAAMFSLPIVKDGELLRIDAGDTKGFKRNLEDNPPHYREYIDYWCSFGYTWKELYDDWFPRAKLVADIYNSEDAKRTFTKNHLIEQRRLF